MYSEYELRYELITEKIRDISEQSDLLEPFKSYFKSISCFLCKLFDIASDVKSRELYDKSLEQLKNINKSIYEEILPDNYNTCYGNPDYIKKVFDESALPEDYSKLLCFLYAQMRGLIPYAFEARIDMVTLYCELFVEIYTMFDYAKRTYAQEMGEEVTADFESKSLLSVPECDDIRKAISSFEFDNLDFLVDERIADQIDPSRDFAVKIIEECDLNDERYLYYFGEYISDEEVKISKYLGTLDEKTIGLMADTFTEGYRIGFVNAKKPIEKKKTVNIRYNIGFERVVRQAISNFEKMGLKPIVYRAATLSSNKKGLHKIGYTSLGANRQYDFDHKEDEAVYLDHDLIVRKLAMLENSYRQRKELANTHGGPAVIEVFGEEEFNPVNKKTAVSLSRDQQKISVEYASKAGETVNNYIIGEERSFTIIAFPIPAIGPDFEEIFDETIRLNTLDYKLYRDIQQKIIDALDGANRVVIKGKGNNITDVTVALAHMSNPDKETLFENCVADVNIPVGEVFTSPKLSGTEGILNVGRVYLEGLMYKNLTLIFKDGMVTDYHCDNFSSEKENRKLIKDNILFHHDKLPLGEFAIGTNTLAYVMARKYNIEDKLPILIGEKTGPHFAVGDTCYSHEEDVKVYNPDGKEIIARENEVSRLRHEDSSKAYFNCHTDITIPYDELESITAYGDDGYSVVIIKDGRFVLEGCEELNKAF